ncbi:unnamed protein product [Effrenium voratum]|nr:unnamed protein product [Effrenium voratum]
MGACASCQKAASPQTPPVEHSERGQEHVAEAEFGFLGAKQAGVGPWLWGVSLVQLTDLSPRHEWTMRDMVDKSITPTTRGTGLGYALKLNFQEPRVANIMVSHAWDELYSHFMNAIHCFVRKSMSEGAAWEANGYWVCATAIYQAEDVPELTIEKQLGPDPRCGPFAAVLRQASTMVACITEACSIYSRMWCVFELFMAKELAIPVFQANGDEIHSGSVSTGSEFESPVVDAFGRQCLQPVNSKAARCGPPLVGGKPTPMNKDERMIREAIERSVGQFSAVDYSVEQARLETLEHFLEEERARHRDFSEAKKLLEKFWGIERMEAFEQRFVKVFELYSEVIQAVKDRLDHLSKQLEMPST